MTSDDISWSGSPTRESCFLKREDFRRTGENMFRILFSFSGENNSSTSPFVDVCPFVASELDMSDLLSVAFNTSALSMCSNL